MSLFADDLVLILNSGYFLGDISLQHLHTVINLSQHFLSLQQPSYSLLSLLLHPC